MYLYYASVFNYKEYQTEIYPLVEEVDRGNYVPLRERACEAIQRFRRTWPCKDLGFVEWRDGKDQPVLTQAWPLLEHAGEGLPTEEGVRSQETPTPSDLGDWFILILAEFVAPKPYRVDGFIPLRETLKVLGWSPQDVDMLFAGFSTHLLLKPEVKEAPPYPLRLSSPYWFWVHAGSGRSGWLPNEKVQRLHDELLSENLLRRIKSFDVRRLEIPGVDFDNPVVVRDYEQWLQSAYRSVWAMLADAKSCGQGLFITTRLG